MIEIQHGVKLFIVFYETHILGIGLKMDSICVVYIVSYQSFNDLFEVKPSRNIKKFVISPNLQKGIHKSLWKLVKYAHSVSIEW